MCLLLGVEYNVLKLKSVMKDEIIKLYFLLIFCSLNIKRQNHHSLFLAETEVVVHCVNLFLLDLKYHKCAKYNLQIFDAIGSTFDTCTCTCTLNYFLKTRVHLKLKFGGQNLISL